MLSTANAKHILDKYHNNGIHSQYADHSQWMHRATLPMGVKDGGKEETSSK